MSVTLRLAQPVDAAAMLAIYTPYVQNTTVSWEYEPPALAEFAARLAEKQAAGFPWLVAEAHGEILGYAYAGRFAARKGYDWTVEPTIYLAETARGRGVGKRLYTALLTLLRMQGYCTAVALVTHPNPGSEVFHKAMGFAQAACLEHMGYKQGKWLGLSYFTCALQPLPAAPKPPQRLDALCPDAVQAVLQAAL